MKQWNYNSVYRTFSISEEAFEKLCDDAEYIALVDVYRDSVDDDPNDLDEFHAVTDFVYATDGGDLFRLRENHGSFDDSYELIGEFPQHGKRLRMFYEHEWKQQDHDEMQDVWFEWRAGGRVPDELDEVLPHRIEP